MRGDASQESENYKIPTMQIVSSELFFSSVSCLSSVETKMLCGTKNHCLGAFSTTIAERVCRSPVPRKNMQRSSMTDGQDLRNVQQLHLFYDLLEA